MNGEHSSKEVRTEEPDDAISTEARQYAHRMWRDNPDSYHAYMMGVRHAVEKMASQIEKLRASIPTGDYVLVDDMDESNDRRYGKGLFSSFDNIKSVS